MEESKPRYNLKVIVQETGIKPDTLRAWERRYELPAPARTEGGHRLYSQRDLVMIQWLLARREEGLSISQAVQLWRDIEASGRDPLQDAAAPAPVQAMAPATAADDLATLRQAWLHACMNFDEVAAERLLALALARHAPELVCLELIQKGVNEIGRLWYDNEATVQQEHFASALALRRADALLTTAPPPGRSQLIYLACPPQEEHSFPLLLLALMLRYRGWPVAYLGANVPLAQMESALQANQPALVVLAAQTLPAAAEALSMAHLLQSHETRLAYGGRIFNQLAKIRQTMPGDFLGESLLAATEKVAEILTVEPPMPAGKSVSAAYHEALACFGRQRPLLEWHVRRTLQAERWPDAHLQVANWHVAENIQAALTFGDLTLIDQEITSISRLLSSSGRMPEDHLGHYFSVYHQVAQEHLDEACRPIIEWLATARNLT